MGPSLHPKRLKRYRDIARLLFKYGRKDLVNRAGLEDVRILGYPAFAMIFFLAAAAGGMWLAVSIVRSDLPQKRRR